MAIKKSKSEPKYKLTVSLSTTVARRFAAYCALIGKDQCDVIEVAVKNEMLGFRVSLARPDAGDDSAEPTAGPSVRIHEREAV